MRLLLITKTGTGAVFRIRNSRTGREGGLSMWKYLNYTNNMNNLDGIDNLDTCDVIACWNPFEYCNLNDWSFGDKIIFLDYIPELIGQLNGYITTAINVINSKPSIPLIPLVVRISSFSSLNTGWNNNGDLVAFGQCGVVGGWWKELALEASKYES